MWLLIENERMHSERIAVSCFSSHIIDNDGTASEAKNSSIGSSILSMLRSGFVLVDELQIWYDFLGENAVIKRSWYSWYDDAYKNAVREHGKLVAERMRRLNYRSAWSEYSDGGSSRDPLALLFAIFFDNCASNVSLRVKFLEDAVRCRREVKLRISVSALESSRKYYFTRLMSSYSPKYGLLYTPTST